MKFEALRRSLVRWLRPPATSVSPQNRPDPVFPLPPVSPAEAVRRHMESGGRIEDIPGFHDTHLAESAQRPGIQPPPDPDVDRSWLWSEWVRERETFSLPSWNYCRFPLQYPGDRAVFVFGMVCGNFGVYHCPITVVNRDLGRADESVLVCLTHLPSGMGMGVFTCRHVAAQAADIAESVDDRWPVLDIHSPEWPSINRKLVLAFRNAGIAPALNVYATRGRDGIPWNIFGRSEDVLMEGRPDRLS